MVTTALVQPGGLTVGDVDEAGPGGTLAPQFEVLVNNNRIDVGVSQLVRSIEFETADGIAAMCKLTVENPDFIVSDRNVFQPGNEMLVRMGYGSSHMKRLGRVVLAEVKPNYPSGSDTPTVEVVGYSKDKAMMGHSPQTKKDEKSAASKKQKGFDARQKGKITFVSGFSTGGNKKQRSFPEMNFSEIVERKAKEYGFIPDVDKTTRKTTVLQVAGMTDYEFVRGLANMLGWVFWVDGDDNGKWALHFRDASQKDVTVQDKQYTFRYRDGDLSTLLEFNPEMLLHGFSTKVTAVVKNVRTGKLMEVPFDEETEGGDTQFTGDTKEEVPGPYTSGASVKLYFKEFSYTLVADRHFKTPEEVKGWIKKWLREQQKNFVLASGTTVGLETLAARQIHTIEGVGKAFSGDYYFSRVRHAMDADKGYLCDFNCRKVVRSAG